MEIQVQDTSSLTAALLAISIVHGAGPVLPESIDPRCSFPGTYDPPEFLHSLLEDAEVPHTYEVVPIERVKELRRKAAADKELLFVLVGIGEGDPRAWWSWWAVGPIRRYMHCVLWGYGTEDMRQNYQTLRILGPIVYISREDQESFLAREGLNRADLGHFGSFPH